MRSRSVLVALCVLAFLAAPRAGADIIVYGTHTDHAVVPGASLEDVRLLVGLSADGGVATVSFTNVSVGSAVSGVLEEIVLDTHDGDTNQAVLWDPQIVTDETGIGFTFGESNGLPGYQAQTVEAFPLVEFQAKPPPVFKGLGLGETLVVQFATALADAADTDDYLAFFGGGADTAEWAVGFHAISVGTVDGESLSGIYMPEPSVLVLVAIGGCLGVLRRRR